MQRREQDAKPIARSRAERLLETLHRLEENLAAADVALTSDDLAELDGAAAGAVGARYSESAQRMIDR